MTQTASPNRARVTTMAAGQSTAELRNDIVIERNGVTFSRAKNNTADLTYVPPDIIPVGVQYQWNRISTHNQVDFENIAQNQKAGWRPVPAERHPGRYMPLGTVGEIVHGGLRLEERPIEWERESIEESKKAARAQINSSRAMFGIETTDREAFSTSTPGARKHTFSNETIESGADIPGPAQIPIDD